MRTTLTLDPDVASALKERAKREDKPYKQVANDLLRLGMAREKLVIVPDVNLLS